MRIIQPLDLPPEFVDFHQARDDVEKGDQPEAERGVDAAGDLRRAQQPADVEMLAPQPGDGNAVAVEPVDRRIKRLIARGVGEQRSPTRPNPQAASEAKARHTATVTIMVMASASSVGIHACNCFWTGHTTAMMNSAAASGANTVLACASAAATSTAAMIPVVIFNPKLPILAPSTFPQPKTVSCIERRQGLRAPPATDVIGVTYNDARLNLACFQISLRRKGAAMSRFKSLLLCCQPAGRPVGLRAGAAFAEAPNADIRNGMQTPPPADQRVALVIGNSNYQTAPKLANPDNDAQSVAQLLNSAGFEVTAATDLTRNDMVRVVQDFSAKVAERGPDTVAMIYYAGHGVQVAGENYLLPVDAKIATPSDLVDNSLRLVDLMGDAGIDPEPDAHRHARLLPQQSVPRASTTPDAALPSSTRRTARSSAIRPRRARKRSTATAATARTRRPSCNIAREPNLPIEQLFKRVRLEVNNVTDGRQTPWESSSLTSDFYFFGDTAVAARRAPERSPMVQMASDLPSRSVDQVYDYVLSEGSPEYYQEFIRLLPHDPRCDRIRILLVN